jgi:hypothetical protein
MCNDLRYSQLPVMVHRVMVQSRLWYRFRLDGPTFMAFTNKFSGYCNFSYCKFVSSHLGLVTLIDQSACLLLQTLREPPWPSVRDKAYQMLRSRPCAPFHPKPSLALVSERVSIGLRPNSTIRLPLHRCRGSFHPNISILIRVPRGSVCAYRPPNGLY